MMATLTDAPVRSDVSRATHGGAPLQKAIAIARICMGFTFLWAFLDKVFGLGFSTAPEGAWVAGGSPTTGFLTHATTESPFGGLFASLANNWLVDWIFMLGLLGVGVSLMLGIGVRVGAVAGALMLLFMYLAEFPLTLTGATNPLLDSHIIDMTVMAVIFLAVPGQLWSFAKPWRDAVGERTWLW